MPPGFYPLAHVFFVSSPNLINFLRYSGSILLPCGLMYVSGIPSMFWRVLATPNVPLAILLPCRSVSASPYQNSSIAAILSIAHRIIHIWNSNYHRLEDQAVCYFLTQTTACYCLFAPFFFSSLSLATPSSADFVLVIVLKEHLNGSSL